MFDRPKVAQALLGVTVLWAFFAAQAIAQQYRTDPFDDRAKLLRLTVVRPCIADPAKYTAEQQKFNEFFKNYFFPAMTRTDPASLGELAKFREELFKDSLWNTTNQQLQRDLTEMAYAQLGAIVVSKADPPYHPTVRYNAVLMLGLLDSQYANQAGPGGAATVAKPRATNELTSIVNSATTGKNYPPVVILGALIGLERHAQLRQSLAPDSIANMTSAALKIVTRDKPLPDIDADISAWIRVRAASVLANLGNVGKDNEVFNALVQMIGTLPSLDDRCDAAALLARLTYDGVKVDGTAAADQLLKLASAVSDAEFTTAKEFEDKLFSGGMGMSTGRGRGSPGRSASRDFGTEQKDQYPRRPLVARLQNLKLALTKTKPIVPPPAQTKFTDALAAIEPVIQKATDKDTIEPDVADAVRQMAAAISRIVAPAPAAAAPTELGK